VSDVRPVGAYIAAEQDRAISAIRRVQVFAGVAYVQAIVLALDRGPIALTCATPVISAFDNKIDAVMT